MELFVRRSKNCQEKHWRVVGAVDESTRPPKTFSNKFSESVSDDMFVALTDEATNQRRTIRLSLYGAHAFSLTQRT